MDDDIHSDFNACMHRDYCRGMEKLVGDLALLVIRRDKEPDGIAIIAAERRKLMNHAGCNPPADNGELAVAAACYALAEHARSYGRHYVDELPVKWPWHEGWWKPTPDDRIRELAKAGALIAAEIDRIKNGGSMTNQCEHGSLADTCPLCEANAEALRNDINSEFNACMFRDHCRSMEAEIAALRAENEKLRNKIDELNGELNRWEWGEYGL